MPGFECTNTEVSMEKRGLLMGEKLEDPLNKNEKKKLKLMIKYIEKYRGQNGRKQDFK